MLLNLQTKDMDVIKLVKKKIWMLLTCKQKTWILLNLLTKGIDVIKLVSEDTNVSKLANKRYGCY